MRIQLQKRFGLREVAVSALITAIMNGLSSRCDWNIERGWFDHRRLPLTQYSIISTSQPLAMFGAVFKQHQEDAMCSSLTNTKEGSDPHPGRQSNSMAKSRASGNQKDRDRRLSHVVAALLQEGPGKFYLSLSPQPLGSVDSYSLAAFTRRPCDTRTQCRL
ncbi:hypothetical protein NP493_143g01036 [Ridgeia piscesae]|uniref:Uncharacterized protein n=1 Tax=Ridgeia piscesae TaxID=27915 RepID=A0AAD9P4T2_RIDPI|nr:hypothetical protein NP493_143g01036 [Ridgeia piscesae]